VTYHNPCHFTVAFSEIRVQGPAQGMSAPLHPILSIFRFLQRNSRMQIMNFVLHRASVGQMSRSRSPFGGEGYTKAASCCLSTVDELMCRANPGRCSLNVTKQRRSPSPLRQSLQVVERSLPRLSCREMKPAPHHISGFGVTIVYASWQVYAESDSQRRRRCDL
jgi:hypothetical protein